MAAAEGAEFVATLDDMLDFLDGFGLVEGIGVEGEIAGPVGSWCGLVDGGVLLGG